MDFKFQCGFLAMEKIIVLKSFENMLKTDDIFREAVEVLSFHDKQMTRSLMMEI